MNNLSTTISASDFKTLLSSGDKVAIIDVRTAAEVDSVSLAGAAHFPLQTLSCAEVKGHLDAQGHRSEQPVYLLCASGQRAGRAAQQLQNEVDCPLVIIEGGIGALDNAGASLQKGQGTIMSLERQVRIAAGSLVVIGVALGTLVNPWFYVLLGFVGAGLVFAGVTDTCGMGMMLARMPWNNRTVANN